MQRFRNITMLSLVALLLAAPGVGAQDEATPLATPTATVEIPDLAAMIPLPEDLDVTEPGFGVGGGNLTIGAETDVTQSAAFLGLDEEAVAARIAALEEVGFVAEESVSHNVLDGNGDVVLAYTFYIEIYKDAASAEAGFAFTEDESNEPGAVDLPDAPQLGEQSEATLATREARGDNPGYTYLDVTFRRGPLVAGVSVQDYQGEPTLEEAEMAARALLDRIELVEREGAPGLSLRVLRLDDPSLEITDDQYLVIDSTGVPLDGETEERRAQRTSSYGGASDVFTHRQLIPGPTGDTSFLTRIYRFTDDEAATNFIEEFSTLVSSPSASFEPTTETLELGDEAVVFEVSAERSDGTRVGGQSVLIRIGNEVAEVRVTGTDALDPAAIATLAEKQADCLASQEFCDPVPVQAGLVPAGSDGDAMATPTA